jgi:hypothetical protein
MLLAHLEEEEQRSVQRRPVNDYGSTDGVQVRSRPMEGQITKERQGNCGCMVLHFSYGNVILMQNCRENLYFKHLAFRATLI